MNKFYSFDLLCSCIYPIIKMIVCLWLYHKDYRGALLIDQLFADIFDMVYTKAAPAGK